MSIAKFIEVKGARVHNLRNISVRIPKDMMIIITGVSGSGKSSLAFNIIYSEAFRRFADSLSPYIRQFLDIGKKADVDDITGLSPSISVAQKTLSHNPRSTVGTVTEVYDYMRILYSSVGVPYSPVTGQPIRNMNSDKIMNIISANFYLKKICIMIRIKLKNILVRQFDEIINKFRVQRFVYAVVKDKIYLLEDLLHLHNKESIKDIFLIIDRIIVSDENKSQLSDSLESGLKCYFHDEYNNEKWLHENGIIYIAIIKNDYDNEIPFDQMLPFSLHNKCPVSGFYVEKITHKMFSFNTHDGMCNTCDGLGYIDLYVEKRVCHSCHGQRLNKTSLSIKIQGVDIVSLCNMDIYNIIIWLSDLHKSLDKQELIIAERIIQEILQRLTFLRDIGLGYLTLMREAETLSGGESQRIRLAAQLGSGLNGIIYVLDEPSIGLHPIDNQKLINALNKLRDLGNTVIIVEHDTQIMQNADYIIDIGTYAGKKGGNIVFTGQYQELINKKAKHITDGSSITALYLSGLKKMHKRENTRNLDSGFLTIYNCREQNLKGINISIPLRAMTTITGPSGSGKSTLVFKALIPYVTDNIIHFTQKSIKDKDLEIKESIINSFNHIKRIISIDQSPIGRTPKSIPATYVGVFDDIRHWYSMINESKASGFTTSRFSFNSAIGGGRCSNCTGDGQIKVDMHFMPDMFVTCEICNGMRYNKSTLEIYYKNKNIYDVLQMSVDEAIDFFSEIATIKNKLKCMQQVGLGYIQLGQNATTLSGGEAQRIKLSKELLRKDNSKTLYILDEPTTGLHSHDVNLLLHVLHDLVDNGNTMIIIEHNTEIIKSSDYIIDLGPQGGLEGGYIMAAGSPSQIKNNPHSITGKYL